jgi:hypothetical protein
MLRPSKPNNPRTVMVEEKDEASTRNDAVVVVLVL